MRPIWPASALLIVVSTCSGAAPVPQVIITPQRDSPILDLAARELQRYWYLASGDVLPMRNDPDGSGFAVGNPEQNATVAGLLRAGKLDYDEAVLGEQGYVLKTVSDGHRTLTALCGGTDVATLYAVYDLLERYGFGFYLGGDTVPPRGHPGFLPLDEVRVPALRIRGSLPWYNFLNSPTTWNLADHKRFYDQMAKMRMNFVGFHAYDHEPFCAVKVDGQYRYGQPLQNTSQPVWGTVPMGTAEFGFGTGECFAREFFGAEDAFDYGTPEEGIEKAQETLAQALAYARERGIRVCVGFEVTGDASDPEVERDLTLRMRHVLHRYPGIQYVWLWQSEGRGAGGDQPTPPRGTGFGNYYHRVAGAFSYLQEPARIAEAVRVSYFSHLGHKVLQRSAPEVRLIVSGWGGDRWMRFSDFYTGLDKTLPRDVIFAALDNIDPTATPTVSAAYGGLSPERERWPIPWFESDGGGTRRDQWGPQCNVLPFTSLCRDALGKGAQGLLGIHWRTRGVEEVAAYVAQFAWDPSLSYEAFYDAFSRRCFGDELGPELSSILRDLEALGPRWTGSHGQVECGRFSWFLGAERPIPEKLAKLASIEQRLVELRPSCPARCLDRWDYLLHTIRWLVRFDEAALELQPGGTVEQAIAAAEAAKREGRQDAGELARSALEALQQAGLGEAFSELAQLLTNQGEMGVLATANGKAYAAYRDMARRVAAVLETPLPVEPTFVEDLQLAVTVTPDRIRQGTPLELAAIARTNRPPATVSLHWRPLGEAEFRSLDFEPGPGATFRVAADVGTASAVEFCVEAGDAAGRRRLLPSGGREAPFTAAVLPVGQTAQLTRDEPEEPAAPLPCLGLEARNTGPYEVTLTWVEPQGSPTHHWEVYRLQGQDRKLLGEPRLPGFVDFGVMPSRRCDYAVRPVLWGGATGPEATVAIQTPEYPPPGVPEQVSAQPGVRSVHLSWAAGRPGVGHYRILRASADEPERQLAQMEADPAGGAGEVFLDEDTPPEKQMTYRVVAVALSGDESAPSAPASAAAWAAPHAILTASLNGSLATGQGLEATAPTAPEFVDAGQRRALQLGPRRWLDFGSRPEFDIASAITLKAWAKLSDVDGIPVLISHARWHQQGYFLQVLGGRMRFHVALEGGTVVLDAGRIETGRWHQLVGTFDGKTARVYQDGKLVGRQGVVPGSRPSIVPYPGPLYLGRYEDDAPQYEVHGQVAEVGVYAGALPEQDVAAEYEALAAQLR